MSYSAEHFPRVDPVVIMLAEHEGRVLLARQPQYPPGRYSALAGFVEPGELIEEAVARELMEEAGVAVSDVRYVASQPWPFPGSLMIACLASAELDAIRLDSEELEDAFWASARRGRRRSGRRSRPRLPGAAAFCHCQYAADPLECGRLTEKERAMSDLDPGGTRRCWRAARPGRRTSARPCYVSMNGIQEVPGPGDPDGNGTVEIRVVPGERPDLLGSLRARRSTPATAAHIHRGAAGIAGPVVLTLTTPDAAGHSQGCATRRSRRWRARSPIRATTSTPTSTMRRTPMARSAASCAAGRSAAPGRGRISRRLGLAGFRLLRGLGLAAGRLGPSPLLLLAQAFLEALEEAAQAVDRRAAERFADLAAVDLDAGVPMWRRPGRDPCAPGRPGPRRRSRRRRFRARPGWRRP